MANSRTKADARHTGWIHTCVYIAKNCCNTFSNSSLRWCDDIEIFFGVYFEVAVVVVWDQRRMSIKIKSSILVSSETSWSIQHFLSLSLAFRPLFTYIYILFQKSWLQILMWVSNLYCVVSRVHTFLAVRAATAAFISILTIFISSPLHGCVYISRALLENLSKIDFHAFWLSRNLNTFDMRKKW